MGLVQLVHANNVSRAGLTGLSLEGETDTRLLRELLLLFVLVNTSKEVLSALRVRHVLDPDVDLLGDDPSADALVDHHTDGMLRHVENTSRLTMVVLKGHSALEGTITLHIDDVASLVNFEESRKMLHSVAPEFPREQVAGSATITLCVGHREVEEKVLANQINTTCRPLRCVDGEKGKRKRLTLCNGRSSRWRCTGKKIHCIQRCCFSHSLVNNREEITGSSNKRHFAVRKSQMVTSYFCYRDVSYPILPK